MSRASVAMSLVLFSVLPAVALGAPAERRRAAACRRAFGRGRARLVRGRASRRREHASSGVAGQRSAGARRLPVADARRGRAEPDRPGAGAAPRSDPHHRSCWRRAPSTARSSGSAWSATLATPRAPTRRCGSGTTTPALGDVVWAIRRFRPDVLVTRFSPALTDTHGHHTASARLAVEAFSAAADPKAYPEQLKYVEPWQARRIVWNKGVFPGNPPGDLTGFVQMDVGGYDALLGASYGELAARSRSMHKSQGFGASPQRGPAMEYFRALAGEPMQHSFLDGVDLTWRRVKGAEKLVALLDKARAAFNAGASRRLDSGAAGRAGCAGRAAGKSLQGGETRRAGEPDRRLRGAVRRRRGR